MMSNPNRFSKPSETKNSSSETEKKVDFNWGVKIPMREGVHLNATIYKPKSDLPVPVIFTLTPYISDSYHPRAAYFAQNGYVFALVDCRGRSNHLTIIKCQVSLISRRIT